MIFLGSFALYTTITTANQKVIVINPGHSIGYDSGASSAFKSEAQVNQELAGVVVRELNKRGYKVYITHTTDESLASQRLLSNADGSSLKTVGNAINAIHPDLALALHHNSGGATSSGYEIYWSSYRSFDGEGVYEAPNMWSDGSGAYRDTSPCAVALASFNFAEILKNNLAGIPNLSYRYTVERDDYLPAHVDAPCILYEGGYLSNPNEAAYLASEQYQNEAAVRICNAIDQYFGGSGGVPDTTAPVINSVYTSATETTALDYSIECNVADDTGVGSVKFVTWTENNGQDDVIWQEGTNNGNGNYSAIVSSKDHNYEIGNYITHIYAYDYAGNFVGVIAPTVTLKEANYPQGLSVEKLTSNLAVAYANNLGGAGYKFAVWSENNGQDDLIWSEGQPQTSSCFKTVINRAEHNNDSGKYFVHCYTNTNAFVGANEIDFGKINFDNLQVNLNGNILSVGIANLSSPDVIKDVEVAVWSEQNGQDDLRWYNLQPNGTSWSIQQDISQHTGSGLYNVHCYLTDIYGNMQLVGIASAQRDSGVTSYPSTLSPNAVINPLQGNIFTVITSNVPDGFNVLVPVWSEQNGQDDLTWYLSANVGNGNHIATIDVSLHHVAGIYAVHVYLQDVAGNLYPVLASGIDVPASAISTKVTVNTPIMGLSSVTAADLSNMYVAHSPIAFPDYYVARGVSLGQFAQMYVEEAAAEGVRADIAFSQAMEETGFLKFGGDVQISQFNFAGLGATGGGVRGEDFTQYGDNANGIRMGIRAQIQHLKAYASTDPLNQACVDARFNYVSRGKAPTINGLSGTWAADTSYAPKIVTICNYI